MPGKFKRLYNEEDFAKTSSQDANGFYRECSYFQVCYATGDQFGKTAILRSKDGPITLEQADQFYDEARKEALEWMVNHPNESVDITISEDENGKQVAKIAPFKHLACPSNFRARIYDDNGNVIVGDANIRQAIKEKMERWEQLEREGKVRDVFHQTHTFANGKVFSITLRCGPENTPDERLHPNQINDETTWIPFEWMTNAVVKLFEDDDNKIKWNEIPLLLGPSQSAENSEQSVASSGGIKDDNQKGNENISQNSVNVNDLKLLNSDEIKNASEEELIALIKQINIELENRKKDKGSSSWVSVSNQELENKAQELGSILNKFKKVNNTSVSNNPDKGSKIPVGGVIALIGVLGAFAIGGLVLAKKKFAVKGRK